MYSADCEFSSSLSADDGCKLLFVLFVNGVYVSLSSLFAIAFELCSVCYVCGIWNKWGDITLNVIIQYV